MKYTLICLLLSASVYGQQRQDALSKINLQKISIFYQKDTIANAMEMTLPDSAIRISGDTVKVIKMLINIGQDFQAKLQAANKLLNAMGVIWQGQAKNPTAYKHALAYYWKLNHDVRYKKVSKYISPPKIKNFSLTNTSAFFPKKYVKNYHIK